VALVLPSRRTCDAALAAPADVVLGGALTCDSALPAAVLEFVPVEVLRKTVDALLPARTPVTLVAINSLLDVDCDGYSDKADFDLQSRVAKRPNACHYLHQLI